MQMTFNVVLNFAFTVEYKKTFLTLL